MSAAHLPTVPLSDLEPVVEPDPESCQLHKQPPMSVADALALPALCGPHEIARLFAIGLSQFYKQDRKGVYDKFKVVPAIGPRCFSGLLLGRYLAGEPLVAIGFGRKTFGRGRG